ncbi:hypothetical protein AKJ63_00180 [candidate division MSBL1 archaeon SCGC-AAA259D18]|uniref:Peptidase M20 dimerisation domain-containing protein n=1 Tax=candidate division MSBL1 archaeon SCGC-AAA259D18 TaxID=1698262 RepID=A0A133UCT8_9EURY|nr:hypothetical protein AKJ63_00180 [candidate division MSBL1 archaeon SCGC-AAA259D18]
MRKHLDENGFEDIKVKSMEGEKPARTSLNSPLARCVTDSAYEVYEKDPVTYPTSAGSGPAHIVKEQGVPVVGIGISHQKSKVHSPNENIRIKDLVKGVKHLVKTIEKFH